MSGFLPGDQPSVSDGNGRIQNGNPRTTRSGAPAGGVRTPTEVMRARRERDARKKAQVEESARLQDMEEAQLRRQQEAEASGGLVDETPVRRRSSRRAAAGQRDTGQRAGEGQFSSRRQENAPLSTSLPARSKATTLDQGQPRPVVQQPRPASKYDHQSADESISGRSRAQRHNPPFPPSTDEQPVNRRVPHQESEQAQSQPASQAQGGRSSFPNAFERWETLSSHWEGLTSYWIRRLQENSNELNREPLNQQMSRQIVDLSAAGSNLFLAVFELQRLRASSDRKFQRWFFETRSELERYQGQQTELERLLRVEREERALVVSSTGTAEAERLKAEELVKEMRRELQISKEEARRAWEELGRREQEERDRTVSLRSGEPTLVGGVQVVPMPQGGPSRHSTGGQMGAQTRDRSYSDDRGTGVTSGRPHDSIRLSTSRTTLESPDEEERQFSYQPRGRALSPTDTDPFTENAARTAAQHGDGRIAAASQPARHDMEFYQQPTQSPTASAAIAALHASHPGTRGERQSGDRETRQPMSGTDNRGASGGWQQRQGSPALQPPPGAETVSGRRGRGPTDPSTAADRGHPTSAGSSNGSSGGNGEYEIDQDGNYRRDAQGRRIPWRDPADPAGSVRRPQSVQDGREGAGNDYNGRSQQERDGEYARRFESGGAGWQQTPQQRPGPAPQQHLGPTSTAGPSAEDSHPSSGQTRSTPETPPNASGLGTAADYSGSDYGGDSGGRDENPGSGSGWEDFSPRHRHPTRLSDIPEQEDERSRRTSPNPSRASWISGPEQGEPGSAAVARESREMRERSGGGMTGR